MIHVYGRGFGEVSPLVPTRQAAPLSGPLSVVRASPQCLLGRVGPELLPLEVRFAGLAPGLTGVYQIDVQMPATLPSSGEASLACWVAGRFATGTLAVAAGR